MPTEPSDASRLAELFQVLPVGLVLLDREGRVVLANPAEAELLGRELPVASQYFEGLPAGPELEDLQRQILASMEGNVASLDQRRELALNTPSGTLDVVLAARGVRLGGEPHVVLVIQDNSAHKRTERALAAALGAAQDQALQVLELGARRKPFEVVAGDWQLAAEQLRLRRVGQHHPPLAVEQHQAIGEHPKLLGETARVGGLGRHGPGRTLPDVAQQRNGVRPVVAG